MVGGRLLKTKGEKKKQGEKRKSEKKKNALFNRRRRRRRRRLFTKTESERASETLSLLERAPK